MTPPLPCRLLIRLLSGASALVATLILSACSGPAPFQAQIGHHGTRLHAQIVAEERDVAGMRVNLGDGWNENVAGFDLGIINQVRRNFSGAQMGFFNEADRMAGVQIGLAMNGTWPSTNAGAQIAGFFNLGGKAMRGAQVAVVANRADDLSGAQVAAVNTGGAVRGAQIGIVYNDAETLSGVQVGLVNQCTHSTGVQIGLINLNRTGFLPVFPLFNFSVREPGPNPGY
jgi:hypothetical protein